ncbi:MAG: hypothetical protein ACHQAX_03085 [Gammaproteobacteria bacterium]
MRDNSDLKIWQTQALSTIDYDYGNVPIHLEKARLLASHLEKGKPFFIVLHSDLCIEIVNVIRVFHDIITIERGQKGTYANLWPAGSLISAKISAKVLQDLHLDKETFLTDGRARITPEGDIITLCF